MAGCPPKTHGFQPPSQRSRDHHQAKLGMNSVSRSESALHPLGLAYALFDPLVAATIDGVLTPAIGGIGMLVYLRTVGCGHAPGLVGALSFALGGYFTGHATNPGLMRAALAVPWALAAIEGLRGRALVAGFAAACGLLLLSGHPQSIAYALALVGAYAAFFGRW